MQTLLDAKALPALLEIFRPEQFAMGAPEYLQTTVVRALMHMVRNLRWLYLGTAKDVLGVQAVGCVAQLLKSKYETVKESVAVALANIEEFSDAHRAAV